MKKSLAKLLAFVMAVALCVSTMGATDAYAAKKEKGTLSGSYSMVVESFDWGPSVTKLIVKLDTIVKGDKNGEFDASLFNVVTTKEGYAADYSRTVTTETRNVTAVYTSNKNGAKKKLASSYITIEMEVGPSAGSPFYYALATSLNNWSDPYTNEITLTGSLKSGKKVYNKLNIAVEATGKTLAQGSAFKTGSYKNLKYAAYKPSTRKNNGLIVWLHGTGEGGTDPYIAVLGNKVANLASKEVQKAVGNAHVLVVQCPSRWLTYATGLNKEEVNTRDKYDSEYTEVLMNLIEDYVAKNKDINPDRIYIGGASNGGSMTMNMLLNYPDKFDAAFFASEGYADRYITDEQIETIKDIPMWFVYAEGDTTNEASKCTQATYDRLIAAGASDTHLSYFAEGVVDTSGKYNDADGTPHKYSAHWSWVYVLNNECYDNGVSIFKWLGSHR